MIRRFLTILVFALMLPVWILAADEPPADNSGGPLRLKRKKRAGEPPAKADKGKTDPGTDKEPPAKPKARDDEPLIPEDGGPGGAPEEDEKDILERVSRNMRAVEEKIGNRELGEPTRQQQQDILRDIDALVKKSENPSGGGGGGGQPPPQGGTGEEDKDKQASRQQRSGGSQEKAQGKREGRQKRQARRRSSGRNSTARQQPGKNQGNSSSQSRPGSNPAKKLDNPVTGPNLPPRANETKAVNDVWGHLPESLRAEMNAYSNPQPFLPRYDRLIREYYKTIAEQGRKKGD